MVNEKFGVGIVGLGNISDIHAQAVINSEGGRLAAAYSSKEEKSKEFNKKYNAKGYNSYEKFLKDPDLDIVSICTPSGTHLDFGKKAADAGKHVVIEKPIEVTLERAKKLIDACKSNGVKLAVIYQSRFTEDAIKMKESIQRGDIGNPFLATASIKWFRDQEYYTSAQWRGTFELDGGGAVINQSIHTIDLLQWMLGDLDSIQAYKGTFTHETIEAEDNAVATFRFKSGVIGTFVASTSIVPPYPRRIEVHGRKGTALLDDSTFQLLKTDEDFKKSAQTEDPAGAESPLANLQYNSHKIQFNKLYQAILNDTEPVVSGKDSLRSLAFCMGLYKSAETGKQVKIDELIQSNSVSA